MFEEGTNQFILYMFLNHICVKLLFTICNMLLIYLVIVAIVVYPPSKCVAHVICCFFVGLDNLVYFCCFFISLILVECLIQ
jgi:hypothetical protein